MNRKLMDEAPALRTIWIDYTNYRGERAWREIEPTDARPALWFGHTEWHPQDQWLLAAYDIEKRAVRDFAVASIHAWSPVAPAISTLALQALAPAGEDLVLRITTAYEQGFGQALRTELSNPYVAGTPEAEAWDHGREVGAQRKAQERSDSAVFKNFHRHLCERFGYVHDQMHWRRDQASLSEHIAKQVKPKCDPVPKAGGEVAEALIQAKLQDYGWPANPRNAGRAGWEACRLHIEAQSHVQTEAITPKESS